jgi:hypothetical protein
MVARIDVDSKEEGPEAVLQSKVEDAEDDRHNSKANIKERGK